MNLKTTPLAWPKRVGVKIAHSMYNFGWRRFVEYKRNQLLIQ
jgi:hypothetical protein